MQMRHALANAIVHCHKRALGIQRPFNRSRQKLHIEKKGPTSFGGKSLNVS